MRIFKIFSTVFVLFLSFFILIGCDETTLPEEVGPTFSLDSVEFSLYKYDIEEIGFQVSNTEEELDVIYVIADEAIIEITNHRIFATAVGTTTVVASVVGYPELQQTFTVTVLTLPEDTYTVTYHVNGGILPHDTRRTFTEETLPILLPTPTKEGKQFRGWYTNEEFSGQAAIYVTLGSASNQVFYARWGEIMTQEDYTYLDTVREEIRNKVPVFTSEDIILPKTLFGFDGITIQWTSSKTNVVSNNGFVQQKYVQDFSMLTAAVTYKGEVFTYTFRVNVNPISNTQRVDYSRKYIFAYYYESHATNFNLEHASKIDYINYSFGGISASGTLALPNLTNMNSVLALKEHGVQIILSVGGWGADGFSDAVYTPESRKKLIDSMIDAIRVYGFAGYDIDWEYPGSTAGGLIKSRPGDVQRFTVFLEELRVAMDELDPNLLLTIAVGGSVNSYEPAKLTHILDFLHLMTYDLSSFSVGARAVHHTNLFAHTNFSNGSAQTMVDRYANAGMAKEKIVIGAAFYGHRMVLNPNNLTPTGLGSIQASRGTTTYNNILIQYLSNPARYTRYWDDVAKAPYIYGINENNEHIFISYDDPESIMYKANYVRNEGLGGMMFWQYVQDSSGALVDAMHHHLFLED